MRRRGLSSFSPFSTRPSSHGQKLFVKSAWLLTCHTVVLHVPPVALQHGAGLVDLMGAELQNWEAQKLRLASASKQQEASLAVQRSSLQQMVSGVHLSLRLEVF